MDLTVFSWSDYVSESFKNLKYQEILTVHSVFEHACNLLLNNGRLVTLQAPDGSPNPLSMRLEKAIDFRSYFSPGAAVYYVPEDGKLLCGPTVLTLSIRETLPCRFSCEELGTLPPEAANMIAQAAKVHIRLPQDGISKGIYDRCRHGVLAFAAAVRGGDLPAAEQALRGFIGLGAGLTPSGDDCFCGFCSVAMLDKTLKTGIMDMRQPLLALCEAATTKISFEFIRCALEGYYLPAVKRMIWAARQNDAAACAEQAAVISKIGSSSGSDILYGILSACESVNDLER